MRKAAPNFHGVDAEFGKNSTLRVLWPRGGLHILQNIAFLSKSILFESRSEKLPEISFINDLNLSKTILEIQSRTR
jgi:hypothetical protein